MKNIEEFCYLLRQWGRWQRGGIPGYRCFLNREYKAKPDINDDVALLLDNCLVEARKCFHTKEFELYYIGQWTISAIAAHNSQSPAQTSKQITNTECLMLGLYNSRLTRK